MGWIMTAYSPEKTSDRFDFSPNSGVSGLIKRYLKSQMDHVLHEPLPDEILAALEKVRLIETTAYGAASR